MFGSVNLIYGLMHVHILSADFCFVARTKVLVKRYAHIYIASALLCRLAYFKITEFAFVTFFVFQLDRVKNTLKKLQEVSKTL